MRKVDWELCLEVSDKKSHAMDRKLMEIISQGKQNRQAVRMNS